jgi:hypothetical protein
MEREDVVKNWCESVNDVGRHLRLAIALGLAIGLLVSMPSSIAAASPTGRTFELVSPAEKPGTAAGADLADEPDYGVAEASGEGALFGTTGPVGASNSGIQVFAIARRDSTSWNSHDPIPRELTHGIQQADPLMIDPSADLSALSFVAEGSFFPGNPLSWTVYVNHEGGPFTWIGRPTAATPDPPFGAVEHAPLLAGASPDLSIVYFTYYGTLVPEDQSRSPGAWGLYESRGGTLNAAGELPNGTFDPFGAIPAATGREAVTPDYFDHQVSESGERAFFVSPDPSSEHPSADVPELYVRETAADGRRTSVLVSRSLVTDQPATDGPLAVTSPNPFVNRVSYVYASPDGTRAFFASSDALTSNAPNDSSAKEYVFDVDSGSLTYLAGVTAPILASSSDGTRFIFEDTTGVNALLELGELGEDGIHVEPISQLPAASAGPDEGIVNLAAARATGDGEVFAFQTSSPLPGFNNGGGFNQVYRYARASGTLSCVSCPPAGVAPTGGTSEHNFLANGAHLSNDIYDTQAVLDSRGLSADGSKVFFDTPSALVPQDVNERRDVYEWENGHVQLISSGTSAQESFFLDNSASGNDVFFSTTDALSEADTDGSYDVYDARIGGGFATTIPSSCSTECQGPLSAPPAVPSLLTLTSGISGNLARPAAAKAPAKKSKKKLAKKKKKKKKKRKPAPKHRHKAKPKPSSKRLDLSSATTGKRAR